MFACRECGDTFTKWSGRCPSCGAWDSMVEMAEADVRAVSGETKGVARPQSLSHPAQPLKDIPLNDVEERLRTGMGELDRVLGGGIVPGSLVLIGGDPGIGKSTLLLQTMCSLSAQMPTLYVTGEESLQQVAMRASRLGLPKDHLKMLSETNVDKICQIAEKEQPRIMVIDSIQVMHVSDVQSSPGSVAQVRESATALTRYAKQNNVAVFIVGHVTKDGTLAGPKVLEHIIDCSVLLDGGTDSRFRTLRSHKNRFGAVNELGVFAMTGQGLKEASE
mgnify:CR=1 FL=1